jgi:hypothetical protein
MSLRSRVRSICRTFRKDEQGAVLVYFSVVALTLVGTVGILVDGARHMTLHSELQNLADAAALAGAAELDMTDTALERATERARSLLQNDPRFANLAAAGERILDPVFYDAVGGSVTTSPRAARVIEITTSLESAQTYFVSALGLGTTSSASARSVAGASEVACQVSPLMLCNPSEPAPFSATRGQMFRLKAHSGNPSYGPGIFGLLDPPNVNTSGSNLTRDLLASNTPKFCYVDGVSVRTGEAAGPVDAGLNVRFDMYPNGNLGGVNYPPAPNVTKGMTYSIQGNSCTFTPSASASGMPRDNCFYSGTCTSTGSGALLRGDGSWSDHAQAYWDANHSTKTKPANYGQAGFTRYDLYLWELGIANDRQTPTYANMPSGGPENPRPQCYRDRTGSAVVGDARHRVFYVAVVDCSTYAVAGNSTPRMLGKYAKFFMTEPSNLGEVYAEFIGMLTPEDEENMRHKIVRLLR